MCTAEISNSAARLPPPMRCETRRRPGCSKSRRARGPSLLQPSCSASAGKQTAYAREVILYARAVYTGLTRIPRGSLSRLPPCGAEADGCLADLRRSIISPAPRRPTRCRLTRLRRRAETAPDLHSARRMRTRTDQAAVGLARVRRLCEHGAPQLSTHFAACARPGHPPWA